VADPVPAVLLEHVQVQDVHGGVGVQRRQRPADQVYGAGDPAVEHGDEEALVRVGRDRGHGGATGRHLLHLAGSVVAGRQHLTELFDVLRDGVTDLQGAPDHDGPLPSRLRRQLRGRPRARPTTGSGVGAPRRHEPDRGERLRLTGRNR
jgi:hypothetical protein